MADILSVVLRAAAFVLLLQASGIALFVAIFGERIPESGATVRRIGRISALLAAAAVLAHYLLEAGRMAGDLAGIASGELQGIALRSSVAAEAALRMLGLALIAAGLRGASALAVASSVVGATLAVVAFTLTGHTVVSPQRWFLIVALALHVLVVAFWLGALLPLYVATRREQGPAAAKVVAGFSLAATWIVPGIFLAGVVLVAGLVPSLATFTRPYGQLLLVKIAGFALLMALAAMNKWRLAPALARGVPHAGAALRRSIAAEYVLIVCVLGVTAAMTSFFSPD
ncbi:MAG TPA: CopD family protein [Steroidobacteraceae bacterium]|nr:CopD family protein [Steroidobacteraceae bacterium]